MNTAGGILGVAGLGLALMKGCSPDPDEAASSQTIEAAKQKLRTAQEEPLDVEKKEDRERILHALGLTVNPPAPQTDADGNPLPVAQPDLTIITDVNAFPEALTEEDALKIKAERSLGWSDSPGPTLRYLPMTVTQKGEPILGFTLGNETFVTEGFFDSRQTDALQATALHTLSSCKTTGDCTVYNGPYTPSLPTAVGEEAKTLLGTAEAIAAGSLDLTAKGVRYEGKQNGTHYKGTLKYPNGAALEGVFLKEGGEYRPDGKFKITWSNGDFLEGVSNWANDTLAEGVKAKIKGEEFTFDFEMEASDPSWRHYPEPKNELDFIAYTVSWEDGSLKSEAVREDPEGVAMHKITAAELATYTGYGKYTDFPQDSKYSGYEGYWTNGQLGNGKGTLVLKNGQTLQGAFTSDAPDTKEDLKFAPKKGAPLATLRHLEDQTGWMLWTNQEKGEWDKYIWDATEKTMKIEHMIKP